MRPAPGTASSSTLAKRQRMRRTAASAAFIAIGAIVTMRVTASGLIPSLAVVAAAVLVARRRPRESDDSEPVALPHPRAILRERVLVLAALALGVGLRLVHLFLVDLEYPFQYGGLFLEFANQIRGDGYALPDTIPFYTDGGIPYAYPPLAFYIEALVLDITPFRPYLVVTVLPAVFAVLTVPSFHVLTRSLPITRSAGISALVVFAVMPGALIPLIEGQGLAEALGALSLIWLAVALVRAWQRGDPRSFALVGLAGAIAGLASPGSAYAAALTLTLFALATLYAGVGAPRQRVRNVALAAAVALVATSPYWLTVLAHHGLSVYFESVRAEHDHALYEVGHWQVGVRKAVGATFRDDSNGVWLLLLAAGATFALFHRPYRAIVGWCALLLAIPREGPWMASIPGSVLVGIGIADVGGAVVAEVRRRARLRRLQPALGAASVVVGLLLTYSLFTHSTAGAIHDLMTGEEGLDDETVAAMHWVAASTPENAPFVVVSRPQVREWAPQIARRTVLNSVWGSEWVPEQAEQIRMFDDDVEACTDLPCVREAAIDHFGHDDFYLYIDRARFVELERASMCTESTTAGDAFEVLWENDAVTIAHATATGAVRQCETAAAE